MSKRLAGEVALITGAGSGIGEACMKLFAQEGAVVVGCGRRLSVLENVLNAVRADGGDAMVVQADLAKHRDAVNVVEKTVEQYGRVDVLVHSAGVGMNFTEVSENSMNDIATTPFDTWREVMAINLDACYSICHSVLQHMLPQGSGSIVNVSSIGGLVGAPTGHTYSVAKAGLVNLTRCMAVAYGAQGIRTNCICPGLTQTPMVAGVVAGLEENEEFLKSVSPMARIGTAEEMAHACLYFASDESSYCNGVIMPIDGGKTAG